MSLHSMLLTLSWLLRLLSLGVAQQPGIDNGLEQAKPFIKPCVYVCKPGLCLYEGCNAPQCPGGACEFRKCKDASCSGTVVGKRKLCERAKMSPHLSYITLPPPHIPFSGGACSYYECSGAKTTCDGGGCKFFQHMDTLKRGYCNGENCFYNGRPHPHFMGGYLSY